MYGYKPKLILFIPDSNLTSLKLARLIKHTEKLLEEKEEKLCIKVLQTLKEMMTVDIDYSEKVIINQCKLLCPP